MTDSPPPRWRRFAPLLVRVAVLAAIAIWLLRGADLAELRDAMWRLPLSALAGALLLAVLNVVVAAIRWRLVMLAFGARWLPPLPTIARLFLVGLFYNTFVPGSVGGDVLRGVLSRGVFDRAAASYVVIIVERLVGLSALGLVFLAGLLLGPPLVDLADAAPWIALLLGLGVAVLVAARLSGRLAQWWRQIPPVADRGRLVASFGVSLVGHVVNVAAFTLLAAGLDLPVDWRAMMAVVPLTLVAAVVPLAIAGIGPREAAFVGLLALLGVAREEALAVSLGYAALLLVVAGAGGLIQLFGGGLKLEVPPDLAADTNRSSAADPPPG